MRNPALSLKSIGIPRISEEEALDLLKTKRIALAMFNWDGSGSIFWLVDGDPETATEAEKFLILLPSARDRVEDGIDWIWGDLLLNKTSPENPASGYAFDDSGNLEAAFYKHFGEKALARFEKMKQQSR